MKQTIQEKIKQRRRQILVHSYIYYELNENIVSDATWSRWAKELEQLQNQYPEESKSVEYYEEFQDWDGSSGAFLNFGENIKTVAKILLSSVEESKTGTKISNSKPLISKFAQNMQKSQLKSKTRSLF